MEYFCYIVFIRSTTSINYYKNTGIPNFFYKRHQHDLIYLVVANCGLTILVDHFKSYLYDELTRLILIYKTS